LRVAAAAPAPAAPAVRGIGRLLQLLDDVFDLRISIGRAANRYSNTAPPTAPTAASATGVDNN